MIAMPLAGCSNDGGATDQSDPTDPTDEAGCQDSGQAELVSLIDHAAWEAAPAEEDPLVDHRPATVDCGIAGWYPQGEEIEIDTNFCNYAALAQPSLVAIDTCTPLRLELYHFDLLAPEPAEAHVAMLIDGQVVWEKFIAIPGGSTPYKAAVYEEDFLSPIAAPAGAEVMLHLHNHGQNTWTLLNFQAGA